MTTHTKQNISVTDSLCIGIDPDTDRSGVAIWDMRRKRLLQYGALRFFEIFDLLKEHKYSIELVRVEAGWVHAKSNFHGRAYQTKAAGERIAKNVGANHETGRKIVEMCKYFSLTCDEVPPMGKMRKDYFHQLTGIDTKNQDVIDAVMLVWDYKDIKPIEFRIDRSPEVAGG